MSETERYEINDKGEKVIIREVIVYRNYESNRRASRNYYEKNKKELYERFKEKMKDEEFRKKRNETMKAYMQKRRERQKENVITETNE